MNEKSTETKKPSDIGIWVDGTKPNYCIFVVNS